MCGLFGAVLHKGVSRKKKHTVRAVLAALAVQNDARGGHAWGFLLPHGGLIRKGLGLAAKMGRASFEKLASEDVVLGHTRWATTGAKELVANAHPFVAGNVVGCHNGVVSNHGELNRKYDRKCEVDSQHIFLHLDEGKDVSEIQAYGAVTFVEKTGRPDEVFVARFNSGWLAMADVPGYGWFWSSDEDHLEAALAMAGTPQAEIVKPTTETLISVTAERGLEQVSDFEPSSPNHDPRPTRWTYGAATRGAGYTRYVPAATTGCAEAAICTSQKADAAAETKALATTTPPEAGRADTTADGTELSAEMDRIWLEIRHARSETEEAELEERLEKVEELIYDLEWALEQAEWEGHPPSHVDQLREKLGAELKADYDAWLEGREEERALLAALGDDWKPRTRTLYDDLDELDIAVEGS